MTISSSTPSPVTSAAVISHFVSSAKNDVMSSLSINGANKSKCGKVISSSSRSFSLSDAPIILSTFGASKPI